MPSPPGFLNFFPELLLPSHIHDRCCLAVPDSIFSLTYSMMSTTVYITDGQYPRLWMLRSGIYWLVVIDQPVSPFDRLLLVGGRNELGA